MSTVWLAVLLVYTAPANSVDWHGPWSTKQHMTVAGKNLFPSEAACKVDTEQWIARVHQDMKAPIIPASGGSQMW
jgi:hypothetical protein